MLLPRLVGRAEQLVIATHFNYQNLYHQPTMASKSPTIAFVGRVLFAFLFLSSGFQKLTSFNLSTGGPVMTGMAPKMDTFLRTLDQVAGVQLPLPQVRDLQSLSSLLPYCFTQTLCLCRVLTYLCWPLPSFWSLLEVCCLFSTPLLELCCW